jgi:exodeoxyribonuclease VII small subunit
MPKENPQPQEHTFESALARLENIVSEMEGEQLPLEKLILAFDEGTKLVKVCQDKLGEAEKKIELIQRRATTGEPELKPLESGQPQPQPANPKSSAKDVSLF